MTKMVTYNQLEKEFNKKVAELKKNCKHKNLTSWMIEWWAMAHETGFEVRACKRCREIIHRRTCCSDCGIVTEKYIEGDGQRRAGGICLCEKCDEKANAKIKFVKCEKCNNGRYIETKDKGIIKYRCIWCEKETKHEIIENKCIMSVNGKCTSDYSPLKCNGVDIPDDCTYALKIMEKKK